MSANQPTRLETACRVGRVSLRDGLVRLGRGWRAIIINFPDRLQGDTKSPGALFSVEKVSTPPPSTLPLFYKSRLLAF